MRGRKREYQFGVKLKEAKEEEGKIGFRLI